MARYAIGDIQGCFATFLQLLDAIRFDPARDELWLTGDIINRGPDSLAMLRWARDHAASLRMVLGNHDLHALAVAAGFVAPHRFDTLAPLLQAPDRDELLDWLRRQPLAVADGRYLMVHAGVLPQWDAGETLRLAAEVEAVLQGDGYLDYLAHMYGNEPRRWRDDLHGMGRLRLITNALTRIRACAADGALDFRFKGLLRDIPPGLMPWFDVPGRRSADHTLIVGHWSALGLLLRDDLVALDTGCLWGGQLSALRLEDRQVFQVPCAPLDAVAEQWHA